MDELKKLGNFGVFAITAQAVEEVDKFIQTEGINFPIYSDPEHKLRNFLSEQEVIKVCVTGGENSKNEFFRDFEYFKQYKYGVAQPAIVFVNKKRESVYAYATQPSLINLFGAKERPEAKDVWMKVHEYLTKPK